ncbi:MAG: 50S ribosomal protein L24 [Candidatus Moraniibacteriota bacterium]|jgi:large subunit ribosomal protein L24
MLKIKKGDKVEILAGKDRGKRGEIIMVNPKALKVTVKKLNMITKHVKPKQMGQKGERVTVESPMDISNVALVCPHTDKPTRVGFKVNEGSKVRVSKKSGKEID